MIRGIGASRMGMSWEQSRTDVIANNVANVNTQGFKRTVAVGQEFGEMVLRRISESQTGERAPVVGRLGHGATLALVAADGNQGAIEPSDSPLAVALDGPGDFVYQGPGGTGYTRSGDFRRDSTGRLVTTEGYPVLAGGLPVGAGAASLQITDNGAVVVDGRVAGQLDVRGGAGTRIVPGALERSNVDVGQELTDLITAIRSYQANQRVLQMQDETLARAVTEVGKV